MKYIINLEEKKLDNIKGKKDGVVGIACDLIKFDKKLKLLAFSFIF